MNIFNYKIDNRIGKMEIEINWYKCVFSKFLYLYFLLCYYVVLYIYFLNLLIFSFCLSQLSRSFIYIN